MAEAPAAPTRIVLDVRALQEPDHAPITAAYLDALLDGYNRSPVRGESFVFLLRSDLADPTLQWGALDVTARRLMPPTRLLGPVRPPIDPFVLRAASLGVTGGARGVRGLHHAVGGAAPIPVPGSPATVVTLLDLAPWELPARFGTTSLARFTRRLHAGLVREAARVIVAGPEVAAAARALLHVRRDRTVVVPLAPRQGFHLARQDMRAVEDRARADRVRLGLADRYLVYPGRFDARHDVPTLLGALAALSRAGRPEGLGPDAPWPPPILVTGASPDDRASIAQAAAAHGVGRLLTYAPALETIRLAGLVAGARGVVAPMVTDGTGLAATEAIAAGTPVIASAVGPLPRIIDGAGILVEPGDPDGLGRALTALWVNDSLHRRLQTEARDRGARDPRTWADVAAETRRIYADVAATRG